MEKRQVVGNFFDGFAHGRDRLAAAGAVDPVMQRGAVDEAEFMGAGVDDGEQFAVLRDGDAGRIGGAEVDVIEQHGGDEPGFRGVEHAHRAGVHPAAVELGGGQGVARKRVDHIDETAVR